MAKKLPLQVFKLTLPLPPGINSQYATVNNRRVLSEVARKWKKEAGRRIERALEDGRLKPETALDFKRCYLGFYLEYYFQTPHKRDLDGGLKITLDAVCEALELNDNRVVDIHLAKKIDPLNPRLELELEGITDWEFDEQYILLEKPSS